VVAAGTGTGKTTMITRKQLNLIKEENLKPERLIMLTFSKPVDDLVEQFVEHIFRDPVQCSAEGVIHEVQWSDSQ